MTTRPPVIVTTTYLHLPSRAHFRPALRDDAGLLVLEAREPHVPYYRFLYDAVGRDYHWVERLGWTDEALRAYLARPTTTVLVLYAGGVPVGYVELDAAGREPGTEIAYFGLIPSFHGRGLGKHLLSVGVARAFDDGAERVWLHTCTLDGPHAIANYQARGFLPYRTTRDQQTLHPAVAHDTPPGPR